MSASPSSLDQRLRARLATGNINQVELARALNRKQPWVHKLLAGLNARPTLDDWVGIARYLNLTLSELIRGAGARETPVAAVFCARSERERALLKAWRRIPDPALQKIALDVMVAYAKRMREVRRLTQSTAREVRIAPPATARVSARPRSDSV